MNDIPIKLNLRVSLWLEYSDYTMPCEFISILENVDSYTIQVNVWDADSFVKVEHIGNKFYFGHPKKILGYGILNSVSNAK